jgi:hypothetical protein
MVKTAVRSSMSAPRSNSSGGHEARRTVLAVAIEAIRPTAIEVEVAEVDGFALEVVDHRPVVEIDGHEAAAGDLDVRVENCVERGK